MKITTLFRLLIVIVLLSGSPGITGLRAQMKVLPLKEQSKILKKADVAYQDLKYPEAIGYYENYLQSVPNDPAVLSKLADCYWHKRAYNDAFRIYKRLFRKGNMGATKEEHLRVSGLYARIHDYNNASQWLNGVEGFQSKAIAYNDLLTLKAMRKDSANWHLELLDINTIYQEFSPFIADNIMYFSSNRLSPGQAATTGTTGNKYDRLWQVPLSQIHAIPRSTIEAITKREYPMKSDSSQYLANVDWYNEKNNFMDKLFFATDSGNVITLVKGMEDIRYNVGAVSVDKNNHFYFSANYPNSDRRGINRLRLMEGFITPHGTMKTKTLPFGDPRLFTVMHPAINKDGTFLVISSDKPGNKGCYDLYYTQRKDMKQPWDTLTSFGKNINTAGNEVFPTITSDGFLYFSSDALPGLGGLDIYRISLQDAIAGKGEPQHLSYPVNSPSDDFGWTQDETTINGYFTSDRLNNNNNIYSFSYKEPTKMLSIDNKVMNRETMQPIDGATLFLYNKKDGKIYIAKTDKEGKYRFEVPDAKDVIVKAVGKGFASFCLPVNAVNISQVSDTVIKASNSFSMEKLKINYAWKLDVMYYDFNKSDLNAATRFVLDSLSHILKKYPISVEISSHTDSRGTVEYNDRLSLRRSQAVVNYLVGQGIDSTRLIAKGYGKSKLLNRCVDGVPCTDQEHQVNRRTEVKVIDYNVDQKSALDDIDPDKFKSGDVVNKKALPLGFFNECDPSSSQGSESDKQVVPAKKE